MVRQGPDATGAYPPIARLWVQMLTKAEADAPWVLHAGTPREERRPMRLSHTQEVTFALRTHMNEGRSKMGGLAIARGHFQQYAPFLPLARRLGALSDAR